MEKLDLAYVAGLFDGDGCVYIHKLPPNGKRGTLNPEYRLAVAIANVYPPILQDLKDMFGGSIKNHSHPKKSSHTQAYQWGTYTRSAHSFLSLIFPYLRIKKDQTFLALSFQAYKDSIVTRRNRPYTPGEVGNFELYKIAISELKGNGAK